jgi:hypothetical protein
VVLSLEQVLGFGHKDAYHHQDEERKDDEGSDNLRNPAARQAMRVMHFHESPH